MRKIITKIGFLLLSLAVVLPNVASATAGDVSFSEATTINMSGIGSEADLTVSAGSSADTMVVGANTIVLTMGTGDSITFTSTDRYNMTTNNGVSTVLCSSSNSTITITSTTTLTVHSDACTLAGAVSTTGSTTPSDTTAPVISNVSATTTFDSATITWDTGESSISWVVYGLDTGYGSEEKTTSYVSSHSVSLTGLSSETTYHYQVKSKDSTGNIGTYTDQTFTTLAPATTGEETVTASAGGTVSATSGDGGGATVELPANAVSANTVVTVTPVGTADSIAGSPPSGSVMVGGYVYQFTAVSDGTAVTEFDADLTLTFTYTDTQVEGIDESSLVVYYWDTDTSAWVALESEVDVDTNTITAITNHFTYFAVIGEEEAEEAEEAEETDLDALRAQIAALQVLIAEATARLAALLGTSPITGVPSTFSFDSNLQLGDTGDSVKYLQIVLNSSVSTRLAETGVGSPGNETTYFGPLTKAGMVKFQETYSSVCLDPWGLVNGTGFVGTTTREKLNSLLGK